MKYKKIICALLTTGVILGSYGILSSQAVSQQEKRSVVETTKTIEHSSSDKVKYIKVMDDGIQRNKKEVAVIKIYNHLENTIIEYHFSDCIYWRESSDRNCLSIRLNGQRIQYVGLPHTIELKY